MKERTKRNLAIGGTIVLTAGIVAAGILILRKVLRTIPKGVEPVYPFDLDRFMGKWYVIGHVGNQRFGNNLKNIIVEHSLDESGNMTVQYKAFDPQKKEKQIKKGVITVAGDPRVGKLKISFSRPIYSGYNIVEIDPDYNNALIVGDDLTQFWLLSRKPDMLNEVIEQYLTIADYYGYDISGIVWVDQDDY